jgi:hypothetical protein
VTGSEQNNEQWRTERWILNAMEQMWKMFGVMPQRREITTKRRDTGLPQMMPGRVRDPSTWRTGQVTSNK